MKCCIATVIFGSAIITFRAAETSAQGFGTFFVVPQSMKDIQSQIHPSGNAFVHLNKFRVLHESSSNGESYDQSNTTDANDTASNCTHDKYPFNRTDSNSKCIGPKWLRIALGIGMFMIMSVIVVGGLGNAFTILILVHQMCQVQSQKAIRTISSTVLVLNLAIADFCYSGICLPFVFSIYCIVYSSDLDLEAPVNYGFDEMCRYSAYVRYITAMSEWTTIGLMALERFITISRYSKWQKGSNRWFTPRKSAYYCIFIWGLAVLFQLPTFLGTDTTRFGYNIDTLKCDFVPVCDSSGVGMREIFFLLEAPIPCFLILVGYAAIIIKLKKSTRVMRHFGTNDCRVKVAMRNSKTTRICIRLISVYCVCVIPICTWNICIPEEYKGEPCNQIWGIYLYLIYWLQYAVNNFIYALSLPRYGKAAKQLLYSLIPQTSHSGAQGFSLKNPDRKEQVVSVISIEQRSGPHSHHSCCSPGISVGAEHSSYSCDSTSLFLSRLFSSHRCVDQCAECSHQILEPRALESDIFVENYVSCRSYLYPKYSVDSEWSFSDGPSHVHPSYNIVLVTPNSRKRSSSDVGYLTKKLKRQLSY